MNVFFIQSYTTKVKKDLANNFLNLCKTQINCVHLHDSMTVDTNCISATSCNKVVSENVGTQSTLYNMQISLFVQGFICQQMGAKINSCFKSNVSYIEIDSKLLANDVIFADHPCLSSLSPALRLLQLEREKERQSDSSRHKIKIKRLATTLVILTLSILSLHSITASANDFVFHHYF